MDLLPVSLGLIALLFAMIGLGLWIAVALATMGFVAIILQLSLPAGTILATSMWQGAKSWDLTALPMFILMGDILFRTRLSQDMFDGLAPWLAKLPGRLIHVNIVGSTIFPRSRALRRRPAPRSGASRSRNWPNAAIPTRFRSGHWPGRPRSV